MTVDSKVGERSAGVEGGDVPASARAVIVGGGIVGCSVAYHLGKLGWKDVVLVEQEALAGGTSWHAAGLVGQLRTSNSLTRINKYSVDLYQTLQAETGMEIGWNEVGSLVVGTSRERMSQLRFEFDNGQRSSASKAGGLNARQWQSLAAELRRLQRGGRRLVPFARNCPDRLESLAWRDRWFWLSYLHRLEAVEI